VAQKEVNMRPQVNELGRIAGVNRVYDRAMFGELEAEYYGQSDYFNFGYWYTDTSSQEEACINLMEEILAFIPEKKGTVLDVACGKGATTRYLTRYFAPDRITGINISDRQLETCRVNAPDCTFLNMDATQLEFPDASFDNLVCVESAFHFNSREAFLREAWRVLKPDGCVVLSDILFHDWYEKWNPMRKGQDYVGDTDKYTRICRQIGFEEVNIVDATHECFDRFLMHWRRFLYGKLRTREIDWLTFNEKIRNSKMLESVIRHYLLVSAVKRVERQS
jgi:MPBQ/MSBQ methyltransferase